MVSPFCFIANEQLAGTVGYRQPQRLHLQQPNGKTVIPVPGDNDVIDDGDGDGFGGGFDLAGHRDISR